MTEFQILEEGYLERGVNILKQGCSFYVKNKLKSEILNEKKVYIQKCFLGQLEKGLEILEMLEVAWRKIW